MAWVKLDTGIFRNPKVVTIGAEAKLLYIAGICYAGDNLTDGLIPANAIPILAAEANVKNAKRATVDLVTAGLWRVLDGKYEVHDYLDHNSRSGDVQAKREAAKERMQRNRSQNVRANEKRTSQNVRPTKEERREKEEITTPTLREEIVSILSFVSVDSSAVDFHNAIESGFQERGWVTAREVTVADRGDGRRGRIDLLATHETGTSVAIECDWQSPREKSFIKLRSADADARFVILRSDKPWDGEVPEGIDGVIHAPTTQGGNPIVTIEAPNRTTLLERFESFWEVCPRKVGKDAAWRWWERKKPDDALTAVMVDAMVNASKQPRWQEEDGRFIPHPTTWLNRGGWKDELGAASTAGPPGVELLPGEIATEVAPGEWEFSRGDQKRYLSPEFYGVIWDPQIYRGSDGTKAFRAAVAEAKQKYAQEAA